MEVYILIVIVVVILLSCISSSLIGYFTISSSSSSSSSSDSNENSSTTSSFKSNSVYCNDTFDICESDSDNENGIELKEDVIYKLQSSDKNTVFYMDLNMIMTMTDKKYTSLDDFLNDIKLYKKEHKECKDFYKVDKDKKTPLSLKCSFFTTTSQLLSTLQKTILVGLTDDLLNEYVDILQEKALDKSMTTFEYFTYYAIVSKFNNKNILILKK
jgi:hypothetical protein